MVHFSPAPSTPLTRSAMKTISETGTELTSGNKRLEEAAEDAAKHEVRPESENFVQNSNKDLDHNNTFLTCRSAWRAS